MRPYRENDISVNFPSPTEKDFVPYGKGFCSLRKKRKRRSSRSTPSALHFKTASKLSTFNYKLPLGALVLAHSNVLCKKLPK